MIRELVLSRVVTVACHRHMSTSSSATVKALYTVSAMVPGLTRVCARACLEYSDKATILIKHFNTLNDVSLFKSCHLVQSHHPQLTSNSTHNPLLRTTDQCERPFALARSTSRQYLFAVHCLMERPYLVMTNRLEFQTRPSAPTVQ